MKNTNGHSGGTGYKVEILTATRAGLAAFLLDLKRARLRLDFPVETFEKLSQQKRKKFKSYSGFIEAALHAWDEQKRADINAPDEDEESEKPAKDDDAATSELRLSIDKYKKTLQEASRKELEKGIHRVKDYIGGLNRDVNESRLEEYMRTMDKGEWWFTPDPIVVTDGGEIINGQHRLISAERLLEGGWTVREKTPLGSFDRELTPPWADKDAPQFVVVWGVDKRAAILMDEARRSSTDRRDIAIRYASSQHGSKRPA